MLGFSLAVVLSHQQARNGVPNGMAGALVSWAKLFRNKWYRTIDDHAAWCLASIEANAPNNDDFKIYFDDMCCADDACLENRGPYFEALPAYMCMPRDRCRLGGGVLAGAGEHYHLGDDWRKSRGDAGICLLKGNELYLIPGTLMMAMRSIKGAQADQTQPRECR